MSNDDGRPWYRQFWLWFVLAPLVAVVVASFVTLYLAGAPPEPAAGYAGPGADASALRAAPAP